MFELSKIWINLNEWCLTISRTITELEQYPYIKKYHEIGFKGLAWQLWTEEKIKAILWKTQFKTCIKGEEQWKSILEKHRMANNYHLTICDYHRFHLFFYTSPNIYSTVYNSVLLENLRRVRMWGKWIYDKILERFFSIEFFKYDTSIFLFYFRYQSNQSKNGSLWVVPTKIWLD